MPSAKEKQQVIMLSVVLAAIAGTLLWLYGGRLLPTPDAGTETAGIAEIPLPESFDDPLFERADYKALKPTQGVPVKPFEGIPRNPNPFDVPAAP